MQGLVTLVVGSIVLGATTLAIIALVEHFRGNPNVKLNIGSGRSFVIETVTGSIALFGAVEWLVIALSRQYHEQLTRRASLVVGVEPEDAVKTPHVRLDLRWIGRRFKRWGRGVRVFVGVMPLIGTASFVLSPLAGAQRASGIATFSWTIYWAMVLACAKTAHAWRTEDDPGAKPPILVRALLRIPVIRLYGRFLGFMMRTSFPPAREIEPRSWEFLGLAVARTLVGLPIVYGFMRPTFPLAAAMVLLGPAGDASAEEQPDNAFSGARELNRVEDEARRARAGVGVRVVADGD
ncbi:MAG: hypothetical protein HOW73_11650 [Polyangiaceae bacterium]|nr:hypothetical protein [Polyangiaceae bacterium]